jgi:hypothetical protein
MSSLFWNMVPHQWVLGAWCFVTITLSWNITHLSSSSTVPYRTQMMALNLTVPTTDIIPLCTKEPPPPFLSLSLSLTQWSLAFLFPYKNVKWLPQCHPCPIRPAILPPYLIYTSLFLNQLDLCRLRFQVPELGINIATGTCPSARLCAAFL